MTYSSPHIKNIFKTFKPKDPLVRKYVDYYYLEVKPNNVVNEFKCFPHYNNTISLYRTHYRSVDGATTYDPKREPLQIFTPVRDKILHVKQIGKIHRIVIVFHPLGIQNFITKMDFTKKIFGINFLNKKELNILFSTVNIDELTTLLNDCLNRRYKSFEQPILEKTIQEIFEDSNHFSVTALSDDLGVSRQYLNRLFKQMMGISVKTFHKIVVFRKTIHHKLLDNPKANFTELAHQYNFSNQSHFNKTYRKFTQNTPHSFYEEGTLLGSEDTFWHLSS